MKRIIATAIYGLIFFYLENLESIDCNHESKDFFCHFQNWMYSSKYWFASGSTLLFILINIYWEGIASNRIKKNINDHLDIFFQSRLSDESVFHRITIFRRVGFLRALGYYLVSTFRKLGYYIKTGRVILRLKMCPLPFANYLIVYTRFGHPNQQVKSTILQIHKNIQFCSSFAEYVYHLGKPHHKDLPNISNIKLDNFNKIDEIPTPQQRNQVKRYMKDSKISSFETLRMFSRLSPYIGGIPLFIKRRSMSTPSHVILYDSESLSYTAINETLPRLSRYVESILINR